MTTRHPHLSARRAAPAVAIAFAAAGWLGGCAKPKTDSTATSSSLPGLPITTASGATGASTTASSTATTPVVTVAKPPSCALSDTWGYAIVKATDPAQRGGASDVEVATSLDATAAAIRTSVPANAAEIDLRTELAKKILGGATLTEEENASLKTAADKLSAWYAATCA